MTRIQKSRCFVQTKQPTRAESDSQDLARACSLHVCIVLTQHVLFNRKKEVSQFQICNFCMCGKAEVTRQRAVSNSKARLLYRERGAMSSAPRDDAVDISERTSAGPGGALGGWASLGSTGALRAWRSPILWGLFLANLQKKSQRNPKTCPARSWHIAY